MKLLVTHRFPHLDDICAIWLWKRYVPRWAKARDAYVDLKGGGDAVTWKGKPVDSDPEVIHVGVGRGKYDEHKGDVGKCCTLLVYEELLRRKLVPKTERQALDALVEFVNLQDTGMIKGLKYRAMFVPSVLRNILPSERRYAVGAELLEASLPLFANDAQLERDFRKATAFRTRWGKGLAIETSADGPDWYAYDQGYVLVVQVDPKRKWRTFRAASESPVDLTRAYDRLRNLEPEAGWFLHHSKRMLLCGSRSAPDVVRSRLTLERLVEIVKRSASGKK